MNILIQIFLLSIVMIIGFGLMLSGTMILFIGKAINLGIVLLSIGIVAGPPSLYMIIRLNHLFQVKELKKVLANPEKILLRFPNSKAKGDIIIADDALFIGTSHIPFKSIYENLIGLNWEANELHFISEVNAGTRTIQRSRKIEIPQEHMKAAADAVEKIKSLYLSA